MRTNGALEEAKGIFEGKTVVAQHSMTELMQLSGNGSFTFAFVQLVPKQHFTWEDIPATVQATVTASVDGGVFVRAKREASGKLNIVAIKWLYPDHIVEIAVTETGELFDKESEDLPAQLPGGTEIRTFSNQTLLEPKIVGWQSYDGQLIAIIEGRIERGEPSRVAVNRLGEQFIIEQNGMIKGVQEDSRLWVVVARDGSPDFAKVQFVGRVTVIGGLSLWLLATLITWQITKRALRPVNEIIEQADKIDPSQLNQRLPVGLADDELSRVSRTVNRMLDRIEQGYQRERQFTGDASHEIRIPLAKIIAEIDLALSKQRGQVEYEETLGRTRKYAKGMERLTESLLVLARLDGALDNLEMCPFDVADLVMEILRSLPPDSAKRICLELGQSSCPMQALGHKQLIGVLLSNLLDNALRYSPPQSPVHLRVNNSAETVHIEVEDEGPGIPEEQVRFVFDRFHRLERSRSKQTGGIGLGLSIVKAIADVHGTTVTLTRGAKQGTLATFTLSSFSHEDNFHKLSS
ncbi:MAG: HAMP domain-containing protein [Phycisphaerae bacterium]|nr:HAMP domain-containing protein [Phycisphaerae bacterium]